MSQNYLEQDGQVSRRRFLEIAASITAMCSLRADLWAAEERGGIPYKTFGSTGEKVSAIGLGGYHIGRAADEESIRIIRTAIDGGVTFLDNCWDYNDGKPARSAWARRCRDGTAAKGVSHDQARRARQRHRGRSSSSSR